MPVLQCHPGQHRREADSERPRRRLSRFPASVYHNIPPEPVAGKADVANSFATVIRPGPPGAESIEFRVINIAANGPVVMTERVDVFKLSSKSFELPVMGIFEISDAKIKAGSIRDVAIPARAWC
jgi:limonene-1,2-epoxide hydrolase